MVIVITGPESSGKSTISAHLAAEFDCVYITEYAREYLKSSNYTFEDVEHIAQTQLSRIAKAKQENDSDQLILADTGNLVLDIWFEELFKRVPKNWSESFSRAIPDLYLLCAPDIPWEQDELRENPNDRQRLFDIYQEKLESRGLNYVILNGDIETRIAKAKKSIAKKKAAL